MRSPSPTSAAASSASSKTKEHYPYFTPEEVTYLSEKQRGKMSETQEERLRQQACAFIEAIGSRMGFPRKTIATGQALYHRFHLFYPFKDFQYHDVTLAALYVSTKMHDTLKKPQEILMVSYAVRFPELAKSSVVGGVDMDPATVENDRRRLLAIERLVLETICFNFTVRMPFPYVIKFGKLLGATKELTKLAWRIAVDSNRTLAILQFPPHSIALAALYLAALLTSYEGGSSPPVAEGYQTSVQIANVLGQKGTWETTYQSTAEDLEDICHYIIDLLHTAADLPINNTSPNTPSSPSPYPSPRNPSASHVLPFTAPQLMRVKISLREMGYQSRPRAPLASQDPSLLYKVGLNSVNEEGKNEGTMRFLFGPGYSG